jgi:hypothetical protein
MPRPRERVCLQDGLKLDLNRLARKGFVRRGANIGLRGITFTHSYWGQIASGFISADMTGENEGWFRIRLGGLDQRRCPEPALRWSPMVLPLSDQKSAGIGPLEAWRCGAILQSADVEPPRRLPIAIQRCDK